MTTVSAGLVSAFSLYPHVVFLCSQIPDASMCVEISYKDSSQTGLGPMLMVSFNEITSLKVLSPNTAPFRGTSF